MSVPTSNVTGNTLHGNRKIRKLEEISEFVRNELQVRINIRIAVEQEVSVIVEIELIMIVMRMIILILRPNKRPGIRITVTVIQMIISMLITTMQRMIIVLIKIINEVTVITIMIMRIMKGKMTIIATVDNRIMMRMITNK